MTAHSPSSPMVPADGRVAAQPGCEPSASAAQEAVFAESHPSRTVTGEVFAPRGCDDEVADIMDRLDKLQGWLVLKCTAARGDPDFMSAARLIQDTRVLLVERLHKRAGQ